MGYSYSAPQWLLVFFLYCVLGWCFESTVVSVKQRHFVNRGFLRGPMLPIYGFGAVLLLHVSLPLYDRPAALFFASMAAATVFEYIVGVVMEKLFKVKYWDYSEHRIQFRGYICLQSSLCWGFLGLILARFIHRPVEWVIAALPFRALLAVDVLWSAAFLADVIVSVRAALDLARVLEELDRLREQGAELRQELSETALTRLTNLSYRVEEAAGELAERTRDAREEAQSRRRESGMRIYGSDVDPACVELSRANAQRAGVASRIAFACADARAFASPEPGARGTIVTNPPYGERLGDLASSRKLAEAFGRALRENVPSWQIYVISADEDFARYFGRRPDKVRKLYNGMLRCSYFQFFKKTTIC